MVSCNHVGCSNPNFTEEGFFSESAIKLEKLTKKCHIQYCSTEINIFLQRKKINPHSIFFLYYIFIELTYNIYIYIYIHKSQYIIYIYEKMKRI
jgi:hypothetical protein